MIPKSAVKDFMERERNDFRWMKKLSRSEIIDLKNELPTKPPIWKVLRQHQRVCFMLGAKERYWGFHLDTGMGKTLLTISLGRYFKKMGEAKHILVLVPNKVNISEWKREMRKWGCRDFRTLRGSTKQKWEVLDSTNKLFIITTYGGFIRMASELVKVKGKRKHKLVPSRALVRKLVNKFDGFVCDESTNVASKHALATRILRQLRKVAKFAFELTGTPFGKDPTALWAQLNLLDQGHTLGETLGLFRAAFFSESTNYYGLPEYTFRKTKQATLNRFIADRTIRYEADKADLPEYVSVPKYVSLPHDALVYVDKAREALRAARGNLKETKNAFLRMRQISSGFIGYKDDDTGKKAELRFSPNLKLEMLMSLVESIPEEHKIIVFHDFIVSGDMICAELGKLRFGWSRISGKTQHHDQILNRFENDPRLRVLVLNNRFSFGPNLQKAKYGIWYENPVSPIVKKQGRRRFERQGSEHKTVFGYELVVEGTYDQDILDAHEMGEDLFQAIIEGRKKI